MVISLCPNLAKTRDTVLLKYQYVGKQTGDGNTLLYQLGRIVLMYR